RHPPIARKERRDVALADRVDRVELPRHRPHQAHLTGDRGVDAVVVPRREVDDRELPASEALGLAFVTDQLGDAVAPALDAEGSVLGDRAVVLEPAVRGADEGLWIRALRP